MGIFDYLKGLDSVDAATAAVIAAILTPLSTLQGAIFKFYTDGRHKEESLDGSKPIL